MSTSKKTSQHNTSSEIPACPYCQRRFATLDQLTLHIVTRHTRTGGKGLPAQSGSGKA